MDTNNIGENLCSVITMVGKSLLEGLRYDTTIECTVIDDTKADAGEYRVSNGSASFIALSTSKYKNNDKVYVTIPGGDYDNDKLIVGKVSSKDSQEPYNYIAPLTSFYNISGNLNETSDGKWGLLANDDQGEKRKDHHAQGYELFSITDMQLAGFTRLGLRASFKSWLPTQDCLSGDYGLRLEVTFKVDNTVNGDSEFDYITKDLFLNTQDMIGNPYAFEIEFSQEKMFDISGLGEITQIKVFFLQSDPGTFKDRKEEPIAYRTELEYLPDNIWVSNIEIGVGYDINDYPGEFLQLYTMDSLYYNPKYDTAANHKKIYLRWLHEGPNGKYQIDEDSSEPFEIRWYRYKLGNPSPDEYAGVNWELINLEEDGACGRRFVAEFDPEIKKQQEYIKVIILYGEEPGYYDYAAEAESFFKDDEGKINKDIFDKDFKNYYVKDKNAKDEVYYRRLTRDDWDNLANLILAYKIDDREVYRSESIVFNNEKDMPSESTMAALSALKIYCYDVEDGQMTASAGNYLLYNEQNELIDKAQASIDRYLVWGLDIEDFDVNNVSNITWSFPTSQTMITVNGLTEDQKNTGIISITDGKAGNESYDVLNGFKYYISNKYSVSKTNNTIGLSVTHSGIVYTAAIELSFGQAGTMGSKGTFIIDFADARTAITVGETEPIGLVARLYGINGDEISLNNYSVKWDWHICPSMLKADDTNGLEFKTTEGTTCDLQPTTNLAMSQMYIVKATLQGWQTESIDGSYDLIAFLPIPLRAEAKYRYITGADKIVYLSDGTPQYYDSYYIMHTEDAEGEPIAITDGWSIKNHYTYPYPTEREQEYASDYELELNGTKQMDESMRYKLKPSPLYYEGSTTQYTVEYADADGIGWTQPILIIQSRYFSSMINDWDGKTVHLNEENGDILASRVGAGRKNSSNQFSGVLMGDWSETIEGNTITNTGLYGFRNGLLSFGFKDDGTAFIGTKTKGQLQFDGNESTITSASYREGKSNGMLLDFDNPKILMRQGFKDDIRVGKRTNNVYEEYGYFNKQVDWDGLDRTKLYRKDESTGEYKSIKNETWNAAYAELNNGDGILLYELVSSVENILPILVEKQEDFNKLFEDYPEAKYFDIANAEGTGYIQVTKSNGWLDSYSGQYFYYPGGESENRTVDIDATAQQKPLTIGKNFSVEWDGTLNAVDGNFSGNINAKSGKITGTLEVTGTLSGGTIIGAHISGSYVSASQFYASYGTIGGWTISNNTLKSKNGTMTLDSSDGSITGGILRATGGSIELEGFLSVGNGKIGQVDSGTTGEGDKTGIGLRYTGTDNSNSEIKATEANTGMKFNKAYLSLTDTDILLDLGTGRAAIKLFDSSTSYPDGRIYIQSDAIDLVGATKVQDDLIATGEIITNTGFSTNGTLQVGNTAVFDGSVEISGNSLTVTVPPENQSGIYARFA